MSKLLSSLFFDNPEIPEQICQFCQNIPEYVQAREEYYALAQELEETIRAGPGTGGDHGPTVVFYL